MERVLIPGAGTSELSCAIAVVIHPGCPLKALVCGGDGYIGSHMAQLLAAHGHEVVVLDDLSTRHFQAMLDTVCEPVVGRGV
jgi:NADPH-dependent 2,4-dienoyl-CoA reductase/sulfur reductase-like enzyme